MDYERGGSIEKELLKSSYKDISLKNNLEEISKTQNKKILKNLKEEVNKEKLNSDSFSPKPRTNSSCLGLCTFVAGLLITYTNAGDETIGYVLGGSIIGLGIITGYLEYKLTQ